MKKYKAVVTAYFPDESYAHRFCQEAILVLIEKYEHNRKRFNATASVTLVEEPEAAG